MPKQEFRDEVRHLVDNLIKELTSGGLEAETQKRVLDTVAGALEPLAALHEEYVRRGRYVVTLEVGRLKETRVRETLNEVFSLMTAYGLHQQEEVIKGLSEHGTVRLGDWTVEDNNGR